MTSITTPTPTVTINGLTMMKGMMMTVIPTTKRKTMTIMAMKMITMKTTITSTHPGSDAFTDPFQDLGSTTHSMLICSCMTLFLLPALEVGATALYILE